MESAVDDVLSALRAVGEATRLRIVALLDLGELSVTELTEILEQSQPRISRHLRLLIEANVIERHREGNRTFFSLSAAQPARSIVDAALDEVDTSDETLAADRTRLNRVRRDRALAAEDYFSRIASEWTRIRTLHAPESKVEASILSLVSDLDYHSVLDLGTGTGRMLQILTADRELDRIAGIDASSAMLAIARPQLDDIGLTNVELRQGDLNDPPFDEATFDLVVIHQVLHYLDDPDRAIEVAATMVAPGGHLVVVDFAPHQLVFLQDDFNHRRLGFRSSQVAEWMASAGLDEIVIDEVDPDPTNEQAALTVLLWRGQRQAATQTNGHDR